MSCQIDYGYRDEEGENMAVSSVLHGNVYGHGSLYTARFDWAHQCETSIIMSRCRHD